VKAIADRSQGQLNEIEKIAATAIERVARTPTCESRAFAVDEAWSIEAAKAEPRKVLK
jgi:hypothetical protein